LLSFCAESFVFQFAIKTKIYRTIIFLVLYAFATWSLTFSEEHRLRMFENRVLRKVFGLKRERVTG